MEEVLSRRRTACIGDPVTKGKIYMERVLFIVLPYGTEKDILMKHKLRSFVAHPYGVLSIATHIKRLSDSTVEIFDCNTKHDILGELHTVVKEMQPDIIGISMMFDSSYKHIDPILSTISESAKRKPTVVIGGAAATASPGVLLKEFSDIDAVCYGEGEIPFLQLVYHGKSIFEMNPSWISRLAVFREPVRSKIENLDDVIDIDYSLINPSDYPMQEAFSPFASTRKRHNQFFIVSSRGCPFDCAFCINSANPDKSMRYASVGKIIEHVRMLVDKYNMDVLTFYDDQLLLNKKRAKELFRRLAKFNLRIECPNGLSVAFIDDELAGLMRKAGMDTVNLAIESGSPYVLNEIIHKPLRIGQVQPVVDILRKHDFWINGYIVLGMPGETAEHRNETRNNVLKWGLDWICISNATPTRGSHLYQQCIENGYIPKDMRIDELDMNRYIITTPDIQPDVLVTESYEMNLYVNFVKNRRIAIGDFETATRVFQDVLDRYPDHAFAYKYLSVCTNEMFKKKVADLPEWGAWARKFWLA